MLKKLIGTFGLRIISSISTLFLLILVTQNLGANGAGSVSLITSAIAIIILLNGFVGGSALVYLLPRNKNRNFLRATLIITYTWAILVSIISTIAFTFFHFIDGAWVQHVLILAFIGSLSTCQAMILLAFEYVMACNITLLLQVFVNFLMFGFVCQVWEGVNLTHYLISIYLAYGCAYGFSWIFLVRIWRGLSWSDHSNFRLIVRQITAYGFLSQAGTTLQFINYRVGLFILNYYLTREMVGIYHVGLRLTEAVWMVPGSIAIVLYSRIANLGDGKEAIDLTIKLAKFGLFIVTMLMVILILLPQAVIVGIFGREFPQVKLVIIALAPGIISLGFASILAHYFAGIGHYGINVLSSVIAFFITIVGNLIFVPYFGMLAAAWVSGVAYLLQAIFLTFIFFKNQNVHWRNFLINEMDIKYFRELLFKITPLGFKKLG